MTLMSEREFEREARRILRRFVEAESYGAQIGMNEFAIFVARSGRKKPVLRIEAKVWSALEQRDFLNRCHPSDPAIWHVSEVGRAYWRRLADTADPFRAQHQVRGHRTISNGGRPLRVEVNEAETSLTWLSRRKGPGGRPLVSEAQLDAGERLRRDFTISQMGARVTADWSFTLGAKTRRDPAEVSDMVLSARERLAQALDAVGRGLSGALVEVCCHQRGLEEMERGFGWPQRSGKVVLQIALDRLADHYASRRPKASTRATRRRQD